MVMNESQAWARNKKVRLKAWFYTCILNKSDITSCYLFLNSLTQLKPFQFIETLKRGKSNCKIDTTFVQRCRSLVTIIISQKWAKVRAKCTFMEHQMGLDLQLKEKAKARAKVKERLICGAKHEAAQFGVGSNSPLAASIECWKHGIRQATEWDRRQQCIRQPSWNI